MLPNSIKLSMLSSTIVNTTIVHAIYHNSQNSLQQAFPGQLNLSGNLARFVATFACTNGNSVHQLNLVLHIRMRAWTVMRKMYTRKCVWA